MVGLLEKHFLESKIMSYIYITSGVKFILEPTKEQNDLLLQFSKVYIKCFNFTSKYVYYNCLDDNGRFIDPSTNKTLKTGEMRSLLIEKFGSKYEQYDVRGYKLAECIAFHVIERYVGYTNRNESKPKRVISMDNGKAIYFKQPVIDYDELFLGIPVLGFKPKRKTWKVLNIPYCVPRRQKRFLEHELDRKQTLKNKKDRSSLSGNLIKCRDKWIFVITAKEYPIETYDYIDVLGFDMNMRKNVYIKFSHNIFNGSDTLELPEEVSKLQEEIHNLNERINDKTIKSKERQKLRYAWKRKHKENEKSLGPYAEQILNAAEQNCMGLAIDGAKPGSILGTFGQEIGPILVKMCRRYKIPFVVVPPYNTSRRCSKCGFVHKKNRKIDTKNKIYDRFICKKCGFIIDADKNASYNIQYKGKKMLDKMQTASVLAESEQLVPVT